MPRLPREASELLFEAELFDDRTVALLVVLLEILQMGAAVRNELEKTATRVLVLRMLLEVGGKLVYAL